MGHDCDDQESEATRKLYGVDKKKENKEVKDERKV